MAKNSLRVEIFVLCDTALISRENKLSVIGIFDRIVTDQIPFNFPKMALVAVINGQPDSFHSLKLVITDPSGKNVVSMDMQVTLGAGGNSNLISEITNFPLPIAGTYEVVLFDGKLKLAGKSLIVNKTAGKPPLAS